MSKYAVYIAARIYHLMGDEQHTECGVNVLSLNADNPQHHGGEPVVKIMEGIPPGLRFCQLCSDESKMKKASA